MTLIQPNQRFARFNLLIAGLIVAVAGMAMWLVAMYIGVVDNEHDIASMKADIQALESRSASLRDKTYSLLDADSFDALAEQHALVKERDPYYVTIDHEWSLVSRY